MSPSCVLRWSWSSARALGSRAERPRASVWALLQVLLAVSVLTGVSPTFARAVRAQATGSLACAVEGTPRGLRTADLCKAVGRELSRPTLLVDDARLVKRGDALQVIAGDVQFLLVWLADGRVRAWTRVSKIEAATDQLRFLLRATRELAKVAPAVERECVQLDPNAGRKMRSPDLTYPWAELKPCQRRQVEVVDPWWLPDAVVTLVP
jgi:hypothetical protein